MSNPTGYYQVTVTISGTVIVHVTDATSEADAKAKASQFIDSGVGPYHKVELMRSEVTKVVKPAS